MTLKDCKNCDSPFNDAYAYCPHCGQKDKDDLTLGVLFYNTISNYFSFDARFFKSFFPLLFMPGFLAEKFIAGKRLIYLHPAQLYLFVAILFFFLNSFRVDKWSNIIDEDLTKVLKNEKLVDSITDFAITDSINYAMQLKNMQQDTLDKTLVRKALEDNKLLIGITDNQIDSIVNNEASKSFIDNIDSKNSKLDSLIAINASDEIIYKEMGMKITDGSVKKRAYAQTLKFYKERQAGGVVKTFFETIPIAMFFLLPIFALIIKLFFRKSGRYTHHLVFSFYYFAFVFAILTIMVGLNYLITIPDFIDWLMLLFIYIYLIIAVKRFYKAGWFISLFKTSFITLLFFPVVVFAGFIVLGFAVMYY